MTSSGLVWRTLGRSAQRWAPAIGPWDVALRHRFFYTGKEDLYKLLGVTKSATDAELKASYRKLAMQFHPDRNPGNKQAEEKFKQISVAYDTLSDPSKRSEYDRQVQYASGAAGGFQAPPSGGTYHQGTGFPGFAQGRPPPHAHAWTGHPGFGGYPGQHGQTFAWRAQPGRRTAEKEFTTADAEKLFRNLFGDRAWEDMKSGNISQRTMVQRDPFGNVVTITEQVGYNSRGGQVIRTTKTFHNRLGQQQTVVTEREVSRPTSHNPSGPDPVTILKAIFDTAVQQEELRRQQQQSRQAAWGQPGGPRQPSAVVPMLSRVAFGLGKIIKVVVKVVVQQVRSTLSRWLKQK
eukprot:GGOE01014142.1.p1 GENE.GGOE01014142.1~~GGOE01014142.1.p1  ORF type:complete len:374 (+),score=94.58 GGOE01014142.1:79-1122(+)